MAIFSRLYTIQSDLNKYLEFSKVKQSRSAALSIFKSEFHVLFAFIMSLNPIINFAKQSFDYFQGG